MISIIQESANETQSRIIRTLSLTVWVLYHLRMERSRKHSAMLGRLQTHLSKDIFQFLEEK